MPHSVVVWSFPSVSAREDADATTFLVSVDESSNLLDAKEHADSFSVEFVTVEVSGIEVTTFIDQ